VPAPRLAAVRFVGLFELIKGCLLVGVALELWRLGHEGAIAALVQWATRLHVALNAPYFGRAAEWIAGLDEQRLHVVNAGVLAYGGALFLIEGAGLVLRHRWAQCVTLVVTASLIPLELLRGRVAPQLDWRRCRARQRCYRLVSRARLASAAMKMAAAGWALPSCDRIESGEALDRSSAVRPGNDRRTCLRAAADATERDRRAAQDALDLVALDVQQRRVVSVFVEAQPDRAAVDGTIDASVANPGAHDRPCHTVARLLQDQRPVDRVHRSERPPRV